MNRFLCFLCLTIAVAACTAQAQTARDFYSATVPLEDYSEAEKNRAMRKALEQVLIRLTGRSDIAADPAAGKLLANAASYALEFGYVDLENSDGNGLGVTFTANEIDNYLRRQQLPIWPRKRAPVLVWIVREAGGEGPGFVTADEDPALYQQVGKLFRQRGLPVLYPLYDFEDQINLPAEQAWRFDNEKIALASNRYALERWLVIRCYETSGGNWRLAWVQGGENRSSDLYNLEAESLEQGLSTVINRAVDRIAADYSYIPSTDVRSLAIDIDGVDSYSSYRKLSGLMDGLSMVKSFQIDAVTGDRVSLNLQLDGDRQLFIDALSLYDQLSAVDRPDVAPGRLTLRWKSTTAYR